MRKFTKLFLLALCSGFLFLGFSNAQSGIQENSYITGDNTVVNANNSGINKNVNSGSDSIDGMDLIGDSQMGMMTCHEWGAIVAGSYWILILMGLILILLSLCTIPLYKKFKVTDKNSKIFRLPLLNIYPLFKITIGKILFYCIMLYLLFLVCILIYDHVVYYCCYDGKILRYALLIGGLYSFAILFILGIELASLYKKDSSKKKSDRTE